MTIEHGVRVVRAGAAPGAALTQAPRDALARAPDLRLVEQGRYGLLPKVGTDGSRPADVYARPAPLVRPGAPRIAIVLIGLGASAAATSDLATLSPNVTFGFAPQEGLDQQAQQVRAAGHETILQLPLAGPGGRVLGADPDAGRTSDTLSWRCRA